MAYGWRFNKHANQHTLLSIATTRKAPCTSVRSNNKKAKQGFFTMVYGVRSARRNGTSGNNAFTFVKHVIQHTEARVPPYSTQARSSRRAIGMPPVHSSTSARISPHFTKNGGMSRIKTSTTKQRFSPWRSRCLLEARIPPYSRTYEARAYASDGTSRIILTNKAEPAARSLPRTCQCPLGGL